MSKQKEREKPKRWLRAIEAAEFLGSPVHSVYNAVSKGKIPACHIPGIGLRIDRKILEERMEAEAKARLRAGAKTPKPETIPAPDAK